MVSGNLFKDQASIETCLKVRPVVVAEDGSDMGVDMERRMAVMRLRGRVDPDCS